VLFPLPSASLATRFIGTTTERGKLIFFSLLSDPDFLRERLSALPPKKFEDISSAYKYAVNGQLYAWDRELGRH
jgi:hypothetical protein